MLVWEDDSPVQVKSAQASGDSRIRERLIREGLIKGRQSGEEAKSMQVNEALAALRTSVEDHLKVLLKSYATPGVNSYELLLRARRLIRGLDEADDTCKAAEEISPSPWAALIKALNIKTLVWGAVTFVLGGQASWEVRRAGKVVGFFSSVKVDGRNAP